MACLLVCCGNMAAQTGSFWENWYGQAGVDMWLQNPYGANFKNVFPNGKSFGVDVALGKWITPEYGMRGNVNWDNGIIKSDHASWIGESSKGYLALSGDFLFNMTNLFGEYKEDRTWNVSAFARAGAFLNFTDRGVVGAPTIGAGIDCTYRLNERWSIVGDVSYQLTSSVIGKNSGAGTGSNGYFDINLGVQMKLGNERNETTNYANYTNNGGAEKGTTNYTNFTNYGSGFWDNWYAQLGLGMSLLNGYGCNFANVFPNGKSFGVNAGVGKWITPEIGIRFGLNWQNGIIGNSHLSWLDSLEKPGSNHDAGGFAAIYGDVFFNLHSLFLGYDENRTWNAIVFPRAGLCHNFDVSDSSPMVGIGTEQTYRINDRIKLFADIAYQFSSSGFWGKEHKSRSLDGTSNGWFDINVGVVYELGKK